MRRFAVAPPSDPMRAIRPSLMPTSPRNHGEPLPSTMRPPVMMTSKAVCAPPCRAAAGWSIARANRTASAAGMSAVSRLRTGDGHPRYFIRCRSASAAM